MLLEIKAFLSTVKSATLFDMAQRFNVTPEVLRDMLNVWIIKGRIRKLSQNSQCRSKCNNCAPASTEIYEWFSGD